MKRKRDSVRKINSSEKEKNNKEKMSEFALNLKKEGKKTVRKQTNTRRKGKKDKQNYKNVNENKEIEKKIQLKFL